MILQDIIEDIHVLYDDLEVYERKYGVLSETFYELYTSGEEPEDEAWMLDWADWAGAYQLLLRRQEQYRSTIQDLQAQTQSLVSIREGGVHDARSVSRNGSLPGRAQYLAWASSSPDYGDRRCFGASSRTSLLCRG